MLSGKRSTVSGWMEDRRRCLDWIDSLPGEPAPMNREGEKVAPLLLAR